MQAYVDPTIQCRTIVGATTIISGILTGSRALIHGSIIGSCIAWYMSSKTSRHVPHILTNEITLEQRGTFLQRLRKYLRPKHIYTLEDFIHFVTTCEAFMDAIIHIVMLFLSDIGYIEVYFHYV